MAYIAYIKEKNMEDLNGTEQYVHFRFKKKLIDWIPQK